MKTYIKTKLIRQMKFALMLATLYLLTLVPVSAQKAATPKVKIAFQETTLKNGLRVITVEDHTAPVVSAVLIYDVGAAHEQPGRTGFAHLFEHMMFRGTENVKSMTEFFRLITSNGGTVNATTGTDMTIYFETVPSNQLDLPLFLESDRLRGLSITKEGLTTETNVVQEERRRLVDNQPYAKSGQVLNELLYDNFAYKHDLIGSMADLNAASLTDVSEFFKTYYAPNNLVMVLVGDFKTSEAVAKVKKYFETIPRQPEPPALDLTEPEQKAERRATVEDELARVPRVSIAFKAARGNTPDFYALQILSSVLAGGQSSRLYQKLVKESELVSNINSNMSERRGTGAFSISAPLRPGIKTGTVEAAIYEEIERLLKEPISDAELQKAKNTFAFNLNANLQRSLIRAINLGQAAILYDDPNLVNTRLDKIAVVTREDVLRVANKYLKPTNRAVVITVPKAKTATTGAGN